MLLQNPHPLFALSKIRGCILLQYCLCAVNIFIYINQQFLAVKLSLTSQVRITDPHVLLLIDPCSQFLVIVDSVPNPVEPSIPVLVSTENVGKYL